MRSSNWILALALGGLGTAATAGGVGELVKGLAGAALIRSQAGTVDQLLDGVTLRHGHDDRRATRVVPGYSVGRKLYVGAYQVAGTPEAVKKVHAVFEVTGQVDGGKGRFAHLIPSVTGNPLDLKRVHGVSVVAAVESSLWGDVGTYPVGGSKNAALRAGLAVAAAKTVGPGVDDFLRKAQATPGTIETRVVPILTFGEKSYVGLAQVTGPRASSTDAVLQLEEDLGRKFKARIFIPVDTRRGFARQAGVGVGTLVDMTLKSGSRSPGPEVAAAPVPRSSGHVHEPDEDHDHVHRRRRHTFKRRKGGPPPWAPAHGRRRKGW